ncbi:MAG: ABC transporter ATP-binding protein [Fibrobacter sp.]|nr:ABC transporter ATP-binding protein [Fibrobacter sp.]
MESLLKCEELEFGHGKGFTSPVDFELQAGEVVALMGRNGSGKSTLLKTLCGKISALGGSVEINGRSLKSLSAVELAKNVAYISISKAAPERMTVAEFVGLGRMPYSNFFDGRSKEDLKIVEDALALLQLENFAERNVCELSDGERSRVYLAQAVAQQVKVLLLDEPNAFLDIPWSHQLFKTLRQLAAERHMGIIVSTHSMEYASKYCDRVMVVEEKNVQCGTWTDAEQMGWLEWTK